MNEWQKSITLNETAECVFVSYRFFGFWRFQKQNLVLSIFNSSRITKMWSNMILFLNWIFSCCCWFSYFYISYTKSSVASFYLLTKKNYDNQGWIEWTKTKVKQKRYQNSSSKHYLFGQLICECFYFGYLVFKLKKKPLHIEIISIFLLWKMRVKVIVMVENSNIFSRPSAIGIRLLFCHTHKSNVFALFFTNRIEIRFDFTSSVLLQRRDVKCWSIYSFGDASVVLSCALPQSLYVCGWVRFFLVFFFEFAWVCLTMWMHVSHICNMCNWFSMVKMLSIQETFADRFGSVLRISCFWTILCLRFVWICSFFLDDCVIGYYGLRSGSFSFSISVRCVYSIF